MKNKIKINVGAFCAKAFFWQNFKNVKQLFKWIKFFSKTHKEMEQSLEWVCGWVGGWITVLYAGILQSINRALL
jgi:hypothetical protein